MRALKQRLRSLHDGGHWYYNRTEEGKQYPIYCRKQGSLDAPETILLDLNVMARGHGFMALGVLEISDDGRLMAYSTDTTGYREYTLVVQDLDTGAVVLGPIEKAGATVWAADNATLFHGGGRQRQALPPIWAGSSHARAVSSRAKRRDLPPRTWSTRKTTNGSAVSVERTRSRVHILLGSRATTSELRFLPAIAPESPWRLLAPRVAEREGKPTTWARAGPPDERHGPNFRGSRCRRRSRAGSVAEVLPHLGRSDIESVDAFAGLGGWERDAGLAQIRITHRTSGAARYVTFPERSTMPTPALTGMEARAVRKDKSLRSPRARCTTTTSAAAKARCSSAARSWAVRPRALRLRPALGPRTRRHANSGLLVFRREPPLPFAAPALLTGYGAYGFRFRWASPHNRLSLLDRGVLVAFAMCGRRRAGQALARRRRMAHKMNSFTVSSRWPRR